MGEVRWGGGNGGWIVEIADTNESNLWIMRGGIVRVCLPVHVGGGKWSCVEICF